MIGAMIAGGLGNQMFQYAAARSLALRHGTDLVLDLSPFRQAGHFRTQRPFELGKLAIEFRSSSVFSPLSFLLARRPSAALQAISGWKTVRERSLAFDARFSTLPDRSYLMGYWQSWRYFDQAAERIWSELQPRAPWSEASLRVRDQMLSAPSLSLHVRRGDYVTSASAEGFHGVLGLEYYTAAVRHVQRRAEGLRAFVFSDDLEWCRQAFEPLGLDLTFVDCNRGGDPWQDLFLMAASRHNIIANSSFSWWGGWMGDHGSPTADRVVIAPRRWFAGADVPIEDRCPPSWRLL
ncbi:MAG: alpha-1,2-fucosyltransferase [Pseudomonadota bacterium]|nr:alpha-1,2-fucosyltransferase [Pseudomonadota bacterium]